MKKRILVVDDEPAVTRLINPFVTKAEEERSARQIGGHTFVAKPISADDLFRVVENQLRR